MIHFKMNKIQSGNQPKKIREAGVICMQDTFRNSLPKSICSLHFGMEL